MPRSGGFVRTLKILVGLADIFIYHFSFILSYYLRYSGDWKYYNFLPYELNRPFIMLAFVILNVLFGMYVLYNKRVIDIFSSTLLVQMIMSILIMALTFFSRQFRFPRSIIFLSFILSVLLLSLWRILVLKIYQRFTGTSRILVVGSEETAKKTVHNIKQSNNGQYGVYGVVLDNYYQYVLDHVDDYEVFYLVKGIPEDEYQKILYLLTARDKRIFLPSNFENILSLNNRVMNLADESIIAVSKFEISPENDAIKRLIDIVISLILIVLTSPIMLVTALAVKLTSKGPVLYKQERVTKGEKVFNIYKFRSMREDAELVTGPVLAEADDPRVTKVGKFIRATRIDELPQLFNVLKGDMSMVGPRPERPHFVDQFKEANPYYYLRHSVRAGITGYAQVYGTYATTFEDKLRFDLIYIKKYSIVLDMQILLQTIKILFDKVSARGLDEEEMSTERAFEGVEIYGERS